MSTFDQRHKNYLFDLGLLLKEYAFEAKAEREKHEDEESKTFFTGQIVAFHRVISLMQQQAEAFGISLSDLRLEDIDPDKDLL